MRSRMVLMLPVTASFERAADGGRIVSTARREKDPPKRGGRDHFYLGAFLSNDGVRGDRLVARRGQPASARLAVPAAADAGGAVANRRGLRRGVHHPHLL